jgi:trigger factor
VSASTVKHLDPTQVELEIAISPQELEAARERAFRELAKRAKIPGFRPGKVPRKLFEAQYGSALIAERAMEEMVPRLYSQALQDNDLHPVDQPQVELLPEEGEDQPIRLRATVSVRPRIELKAYKGVAVTGPVQTVSDEEFERNLEALRSESAVLVPVDRPVELGDVPTVDYEGTIDGVPFEGGAAKGQPTEVSAGRFIEGFAEGIVGMKAGETKAVDAAFPEDYGNKDLAGKNAVFTITVHENKARELPELDEEFAQRFNPEWTLAGLKTDLRARLDAQARGRAREAMKAQLLDALLATHEVPPPEVMVEREVDSILEDAKANVARAKVSWDEYLKASEKTEEALREEFAAEARKRVQLTLLVEAIAEAEKVEATEADVDAEVSSLAARYGQPKSAVYEMLRSNMGPIVGGIVRSKTLDFLLDNATVATE